MKVKDYFTPNGENITRVEHRNGITPVPFTWHGRNLIVAAGRDGRVYLLDAASLGGSDHHTPLSTSEVIAQPGTGGLEGTFTTYDDAPQPSAAQANAMTSPPITRAEGRRWIYVSLWGAPNKALQFPSSNGVVKDGAVVAFTLEDQGGKPALTPRWMSRNLLSPAPSVIAGDLVLALSRGVSSGARKKSEPAVLYALDAKTGKELFSSENLVASSADTSGLAVANGRVYFSTRDNTVYCFGIPLLIE